MFFFHWWIVTLINFCRLGKPKKCQRIPPTLTSNSCSLPRLSWYDTKASLNGVSWRVSCTLNRMPHQLSAWNWEEREGKRFTGMKRVSPVSKTLVIAWNPHWGLRFVSSRLLWREREQTVALRWAPPAARTPPSVSVAITALSGFMSLCSKLFALLHKSRALTTTSTTATAAHERRPQARLRQPQALSRTRFTGRELPHARAPPSAGSHATEPEEAQNSPERGRQRQGTEQHWLRTGGASPSYTPVNTGGCGA